MKLVIGGSTGFVATEVLTQALKNPAITSIVALGRREATMSTAAGSNAGKLKSVICEDFENYPDSVKTELENADACIWYDQPKSIPTTSDLIPIRRAIQSSRTSQ
jgi:predicted chitinase